MSYDQTIQLLHHACQTTPESMQTVKMCNVVKQSTTAHQSTTSHQSTTAPQAKAKSIPTTTQPSPIPKQYCRNYQTKNCRRNNCQFLHEFDPSSKSVTKDDRSENRSVKPTSSSTRSSNNKSNNNNKRNNNNASISNNNSQPSNARLNRLQAQEDDF